MTEPIEQMAQWLADKDFSFAFINSVPNIFYLSSFYCQPHERLVAVLVFPDGQPLLLCPEMEVARAQRDGWQHPVLSYTDSQNPWQILGAALGERTGPRPRIAVEEEFLPLSRGEALKKIFPRCQLVSAGEKLQSLRSIKNRGEIENLRQAARLADQAMEIAASALTDGITEVEVAAEIEYGMRRLGVPRMAFSTIVLFGANTAIAHGVPGQTPLRPGDLVLIDLGVVHRGYCSDITRTFAYKSASKKLKHIYAVNLEAQQAALEACKPGNPAGLVHRTAEAIFSRAGYGQHTGQRIGHGIGIEVHEYPSLTGDNETPLQPGWTFTVEPGLSFRFGGFRIEDDVLITADGCEILTNHPKELQIIG